MTGKVSRNPRDLCPCMRERWYEFLKKALDESIEPVLIETLRDAERQQHYIAIGVSWTNNSKHLPQPPFGLSRAFDVCPRSYLTMKGWNPGGTDWSVLAGIGSVLGLTWGGNWKQRDLAHFQLDFCACPKPNQELLA